MWCMSWPPKNMPITTQPEELKSIEQKVDDARNALTVIEHDYARLQKLCDSIQYTIGEAHKEKIELDKEIADLQKKVKAADKAAVDAEALRDSLVVENKNAQDELHTTRMTIEAELKVRDERLTDVNTRESIVIAKEQHLSEREKIVAEREASVDSKHKTIANFAEALR